MRATIKMESGARRCQSARSRRRREYSPRLTPDGKRLIFTSERGMATVRRDKPWTMPEFETQSRSVLNGYGNIYSIPIDVLPKAAQ